MTEQAKHTAGRDMYLASDRYIAVLRRQRERIAAGLEFWKFDSDQIGAKDTQASWGLCASDRETWPDDADHLFPARPSPKYRKPPHKCPMDGREGEQGGEGCFFRCAIFNRRLKAKDRDRAVDRYDAAIAKAECL